MDALLYPDAPYEIRGYIPYVTDQSRVFGFEVALDRAFAARCLRTQAPSMLRLASRMDTTLRALFPDRSELPVPFRFVGDSMLLSSVEVPGMNGCLLYLEPSDAALLSTSGDSARTAIRYVTHNVDSALQAYALLSGWLLWQQGAAHYSGRTSG